LGFKNHRDLLQTQGERRGVVIRPGREVVMKIFSYIRVLYRAPMALLWTLFIHYGFIRTQQLFNPKKRCINMLRIWGAGFAWIMGVRIHKINEMPKPMGDLIISNHMGFIDIPVLLASFPAVFVIKVELGRAPFFGKRLYEQQHIFVERESNASRNNAGKAIMKALKAGSRVIVFPEGQGNPIADRLPYSPGSLAVAKRLGKTVQACVIDYLPDRRALEWDINRKVLPQVIELFGRFRTHVGIEYFPAEPVTDPKEDAQRYRNLAESRLRAHDLNRESERPALQSA
jgi:1-acyl-sn-glycerol-3-phosphate acyltransferase